jgi:hypothetical protein
MKWQRFNAFQLLVLVRPIRRMIEDEKRGFIDGLLTRLVGSQARNSAKNPLLRRVYCASFRRRQ